MCLNAFFREMKDWARLQISFGYTKGTLYDP